MVEVLHCVKTDMVRFRVCLPWIVADSSNSCYWCRCLVTDSLICTFKNLYIKRTMGPTEDACVQQRRVFFLCCLINILHSKGIKLKKDKTITSTHWEIYVCVREKEGEMEGGCIDSRKLWRRWKSDAAASAIALEDIFSLFFNLQLMRFSAASLYSVVSVYPILSPQPHLLYRCSSPCLSWIGLFV